MKWKKVEKAQVGTHMKTITETSQEDNDKEMEQYVWHSRRQNKEKE